MDVILLFYWENSTSACLQFAICTRMSDECVRVWCECLDTCRRAHALRGSDIYFSNLKCDNKRREKSTESRLHLRSDGVRMRNLSLLLVAHNKMNKKPTFGRRVFPHFGKRANSLAATHCFLRFHMAGHRNSFTTCSYLQTNQNERIRKSSWNEWWSQSPASMPKTGERRKETHSERNKFK